MLPTATVKSQPACSTDFILLGAWRAKREKEPEQIRKRRSPHLYLVSKFRSDRHHPEEIPYLGVGELQASDGEHHLP